MELELKWQWLLHHLVPLGLGFGMQILLLKVGLTHDHSLQVGLLDV